MNKRIKIVFTIPNFDTAGSGRVVYDLVKHIDTSKFEPHVCCNHDRGSFFKEVEALNVPIHIFTVAENYKPLITLPQRILKIKNFFKKHNFDVIHSWHWSSDFTEPVAAKLAGIPFIYTKKAMGCGNKSWRWRTKLSTKVVAINQDMLSEFFKPYLDKVIYMPLGVATSYFKPLQLNNELKTELGIQPSDFVIISVANLVRVKGIERLLEAVINIKNRNIILLIIGSDTNDYAKNLKSLYKANNIRFLGAQQDVRPYLNMADLFVIPTLKKGEGFPIALVEAMSSQCLVIGSNVSGIKDILRPFNKFIFEGDTKSLKEKIEQVLNLDESNHQEVATLMRQHIVQNYSIGVFIKNHENLYASMLK